MMATPMAERKEHDASEYLLPILSWSHPPKSAPAIAPIGDAMFHKASHVDGRIHLPSKRMPKSCLSESAEDSHFPDA